MTNFKAQHKDKPEFAGYKWQIIKVDSHSYSVAFRHMRKNGRKYTFQVWFDKNFFWVGVRPGHIVDEVVKPLENWSSGRDCILEEAMDLALEEAMDLANEWWKNK